MTSVERSVAALLQIVGQLDDVLVPWGFQFQVEETGYSSPGGFARGFYLPGSVRIRLIYRASQGLGAVLYEQEVLKEEGYLRERIVYSTTHTNYMSRIGHADDCKLVESGICSVARDGGDPVGALVHDLREFAAPTLCREDSPEFLEMMSEGVGRRHLL